MPNALNIKQTREDLLAKLAAAIAASPPRERAALGAALEDFVLVRRRSDLKVIILIADIIDAIAQATDVMPMTQAELDARDQEQPPGL